MQGVKGSYAQSGQERDRKGKRKDARRIAGDAPTPSNHMPRTSEGKPGEGKRVVLRTAGERRVSCKRRKNRNGGHGPAGASRRDLSGVRERNGRREKRKKWGFPLKNNKRPRKKTEKSRRVAGRGGGRFCPLK